MKLPQTAALGPAWRRWVVSWSCTRTLPLLPGLCNQHTDGTTLRQCAMPKTSSAGNALRAAMALVDSLKHPAPVAPFATLGQAQLHALDQLATIFSSVTAPLVVRAISPRVPLQQSAPSLRVTAAPAILPSPVSVTRARTPVAPPRVPNLVDPNPDDPVLHRYPLRSHTNFANSVIDEVTGQALEYRHLSKGPNSSIWIQALANNLGRLAQGVGTRMLTGTNTIVFIWPSCFHHPSHER
jgi:hypothetical protein